MPGNHRISGRTRLVIAFIAAAAVLGPLAWLWQSSLQPGTYSMMDVGDPDYGGGPADGSMMHDMPGMPAGHLMAGRPVTALTADPGRPADVAVTLVARKQRFHLPSGREVDGYTVNGQSPGPTIHAVAGQLVSVRLVNESVPDGVTLHWHGVDVPNADDGVAGVTQDAVRPGQAYTYSFVVARAGTFWYHSHQISERQVLGGLLGALVVTPPRQPAGVTDVVALVHLYAGKRTVNGQEGDLRVDVPAGGQARVRIVNTDNGPMSAWIGGDTPYRLVAVDGSDLSGPSTIRGKAVLITAGGRADLEVTVPADGSPVRAELGGSVAVVVGSRSPDPPATARPGSTLDLLSYGTPAPLPFDPAKPDRRFRYEIGRRPGFLDGRPGMWWTVNGHLYPKLPVFMVAEGDVVRVRISNHSGEVHPMHLHGHRAVVLSRNGVPATGSPWWTDSLNVADGESYDVAFVADNPGIWMDHCHNLRHPAEGLVVHLMYDGVSSPFVVGGSSRNDPE
jgi:FtsP/CotA-like multicopper oxidase with cupredoxin domain